MDPRLNDDKCFGNSLELAPEDNEDTEKLDRIAGRVRKRGIMAVTCGKV